MARTTIDTNMGGDEGIEAEVYKGTTDGEATLYIAAGDPMGNRARFYFYGATPEQLISFGQQIASEAEHVQSLIAAEKEEALV